MEALCKRLREDAQKREEEKATLEGMVKSYDDLITEIAKEIGLDRMEKMPRTKTRMRMAMMKEMLPHPLLLWCHPLLLRHLLLPHMRRSSRKKTL
jgi:hypothetical protein